MKLRAVVPHPFDPTLALVPLTRGYFATISVIDAEVVGRSNWHAKKGCTVYAVRTYLENGEKRRESLHRLIGLIMGLPMDVDVDHVDRNGLNNSRQNLRGATRSQNLCNQKTRGDNSSGVKGVCMDRRRGLWHARITFNGKTMDVGHFGEIEEARVALDAARAKIHGEFANHGAN